MEVRKVDKWLMYMEIHQLRRQGFSISKIAKKLGIARNTVYSYLNKKPEEMTEWMASTKRRNRKLDQHHGLILSWLREHPDMSAAQVLDWLKEQYKDLKVGESTVRGYVSELREVYQIPKTVSVRSYQAIPDPPMGQQTQVDFGQTKQKTSSGKEIKLYFISFVLSHSRYKYVEWLDRPFTTKDVVKAHENAFESFGGMTKEIVYDQDSLIVVSENAGDLILTAEFQTYREDRGFALHVCRKADPESKGKIENVVKFIKRNFAKHRVFHNLDQWNEQCEAWLERTGNGKVHNTTKKKPIEVFQEEKQHLRPVTIKKYINNSNSIARVVRKDNTVLYQSNRYSVPLGTYKKDKTVYLSITEDSRLIIQEDSNGPIIAEHELAVGKGKLIQDRQHTRDRSRGIKEYMNHIAGCFGNFEKAATFLENVHRKYPRYIRDQLQLISKTIDGLEEALKSQALEECLKRRLYSANDFSDVVEYIKRQRSLNTKELVLLSTDGKPKSLAKKNRAIIELKVPVRDINEYENVMKGSII